MGADVQRVKPYEGPDPYIFVSYAHLDYERIDPILRELKARGYRFWYDEGIDPGTEWDDNIALHVEECNAMIAFLSESYVASDNCRDELNYARDLKKDRLLVYLSDVKLPPGMAMRLNRLQAIHKYSYNDEERFFAKLEETPIVKRNTDPFKRPAAWNALHGMPEPQRPAPVFTAPASFEKPTPATLFLFGRSFTDVTRLPGGCAGKVYKAYDAAFGREVVVKDYSSCPPEDLHFLNNASLANELKSLRHQNLCAVLDIQTAPAGAMLMEYFAGETLEKRLEGGRTLMVPDAFSYAMQMLRGLEALHSRGIYYGDLTPGNVLVSDRTLRLCDFSESAFNG